MTRKKFIKKLRSINLNRTDIENIVNAVIHRRGSISYNIAWKIIENNIIKELLKRTNIRLDNNFMSSIEYTNASEFSNYDYKIMHVDLANSCDMSFKSWVPLKELTTYASVR